MTKELYQSHDGFADMDGCSECASWSNLMDLNYDNIIHSAIFADKMFYLLHAPLEITWANILSKWLKVRD